MLAVAISSCASAGGGKAPKDIKIYSHQSDDSYCQKDWCKGKVGFVRVQAEEVISYREAKNFVGMTHNDYSRIVEACPK